MKNSIALALVTLFFGLFSQAQSNDVESTRGSSSLDMNVNSVQHGFAGYLGLGAGYSAYNSKINVEGAPTSFKILGSYVISSRAAVFDAGYGIQNQTFSQDAAIDSAISMGVMELAARYQFENRWQLGAIYNQFFNKGVNYSANQADVEFGGVQILREFSFGGNYLARAGGRIMTSLNVNNETVNMAILDFQIGWGGPNRGPSTASAY